MSRTPKVKSRLEDLRARKKPRSDLVLQAGAGGRLWAGAALSGTIAVMFIAHQTQVEGAQLLIRLLSLAAAAAFAVLAWYLARRAARRGDMVRITSEGICLAVGFRGWLEIPWENIRGYRYWEPTGFALLYKRRQPRWVGFKLRDESTLMGRPWDEAAELAWNRWAGRPAVAVLHTMIRGSILDVLEACQTHRRDLDDPMGEVV